MRFCVSLFLLLVSIPAFTQTGKLTDSIAGSGNNRYAVYVPEIKAGKKLPLLMFFEPGGRAALPLLKYSALADQYQIILASSYGCRNGPIEPSVNAAYHLLADLKKNLQIDSSSIFLCGFSGGARLATRMAITDPQFAGVIAGGASFPADQTITRTRKIPYAMIIGQLDMNYLEIVKNSVYLDSIQNPFVRVESNQGHEWPRATILEKALRWQLSLKKLLLPEYSNEIVRRDVLYIDSLVKANDWMSADTEVHRLRSYRDGTEEKLAGDSLNQLVLRESEYVQVKKEWQKWIEKEEDLRRRFFRKYRLIVGSFRPDTSFKKTDWTPFYYDYQKLIKSKEKTRRLVGERLFDNSWRICAEQGYIQLQQQNYPLALLNAQIWSVLNPDQPYAWYMMARVYGLTKEDQKSIENLKKAVEKGFTDKGIIEKEEAFSSIRNTREFRKITASLHGN